MPLAPSPFSLTQNCCDMPGVPLHQHNRPRRGIVKGGVQTQMVRVGPVRLGTDNRQRVQDQRKHRPVVHIGRRAHHAQRHAPPIDQQMLLIAGFGAVRGVGARVFFPPWEPAPRSHLPTAIPTQCRASHHTNADSAPRSAQRLPPASTPQTDHRPFARGQKLAAATPAMDSPSTRRAASHRVTCGPRLDAARLWHAKASPAKGVRVPSRAHRALGVGLT